jgi:hypothetical protein
MRVCFVFTFLGGVLAYGVLLLGPKVMIEYERE